MKINYTNGKLTAEAESVADVRTLLALADNKQTPAPTKSPKNRRGKWVHKIPCKRCGKHYKKGTGMAAHMRWHKRLDTYRATGNFDELRRKMETLGTN